MTTYAETIDEEIYQAMKADPNIVVLGEGVTDPKHIFSTVAKAHAAFPDRVWETPLSENMITGALAGLASNGLKPIYVHARAEFSLLAIEHMVNTIGKWPWLHNGQQLPIIIRMLVGRGWGQGPTHSQSFHGWFASMHGWDTEYPVETHGLKSAWVNARAHGTPTVMIEPRRMYDRGDDAYTTRADSEAVVMTLGDAIIEANTAGNFLESKGINVSAIPLQAMSSSAMFGLSIGPSWPEWAPFLVVDSVPGQSDWLVAQLALRGNTVKRLTPPDTPCPSSPAGEAAWYPSVEDIVRAVCGLTGSPYSDDWDIPGVSGRDGRKEAF